MRIKPNLSLLMVKVICMLAGDLGLMFVPMAAQVLWALGKLIRKFLVKDVRV
jgi:hypothetical protein